MLVEMSGRRPTTIGFSKAPVSKALVFVTATSSIAALSAFQLRSTDIVSLNVNFIIHKLQLWRLITSNVVSGTPGDLFFSITLLYIFRMFERQFGSRKFASAILFFFAGSTILQSVMQIMDLTTPATSGPHAAIFGLLVQYICDIPTTSRLNILGVSVSDKLPTYITAFMYATRQAPSSWVVALCGIAMGALFRSDQLPFSKFRVPNFASDTPFKLALCQMQVGLDKGSNLLRAKEFVDRAAEKGSQVVVLPEMFNCPYSNKHFPTYSEHLPTNWENIDRKVYPTASALSEMASKHKIYLIGGSMPEKSEEKLYNTCVVVGPDGRMITKHRKVHMFDIDIPGKMTFKESDILSAGSSITTFDTPFCKIAVGICYDIRFPEYAQIAADEGCDLIVYPGAFNLTTGPRHWELLIRSRANDQQVFVAACSPARDEEGPYQAWGHSTISSPWAEILATSGHTEDLVMADIQLVAADEVRAQIPIRAQKRTDIYRGACRVTS
eukprot:254221_1